MCDQSLYLAFSNRTFELRSLLIILKPSNFFSSLVFLRGGEAEIKYVCVYVYMFV